MSGYANISAVPDQNILYNAASGHTLLANQNELLQQQQTQQQLGSADIEMGARIAGTLMDPMLYPTTEARAAAYPSLLGRAQAAGYLKTAPSTYPGDDVARAYARLGTPSQTQQEWGFNLAANKAYTAATNPPATTGTGTGSAAPATTVTPSGGATIGQRQNNPGNLTFAGQPGASPGQGNRFAAFPDMPTGVAANADQLALYQTQHGINTVRGAVTRWVGDPKADLTSYIGDVAKAIGVGPDDPVDLTNPDVQAKFIQAQFPHESAGGGFVLNPADVQKGVQMAAANRGRVLQAPGTAIAPSQDTPGGVAARTGGVNVAGPGAGPGGAPGGDLVGPRVLPPIGSGSPVVTPQSLANTPAPQPQAQVPQPPANRVMPGAPDGPPAPAPSAPAGGPQPPQLAPLNAAGLTPIQQRQIDAYAADPRVPLEKRMAAQQAFANQNIQLAQKAFSDYVQVQQLAVSQGQLTNAQAETNLKYWQAAHPELAPNAREATIAFRTLQELAPAMRAPNPPQDVVDRYNNAAIAYQDFKTQTDPISKQLVQVPTRPLPPGFPQPTGGAGGTGVRPLTEGLSPAQQQVERDPAAYKVSETQYTNDAQDVRPLAEAGRQAQADQVRIKEMQDVLQRFSTGSGTEARTAAAAFLQRWLPASITGWEKESANLSGAEAAQAFSKLALVGAGTQERGVLGARGGYQAIKLFKDANPSINLQDATNKSILDMQLISNQANQDYTQAALSHFADNEKKFQQTHQYDSLTQFDRNWNAQRNPQVYAAAMGAVSGQQPAQWTKGLSDAEYDRALQIVSRANPTAVVNTKSGRYSMQPQAVTDGTQIKPNDTVIRYDHSGNRLP